MTVNGNRRFLPGTSTYPCSKWKDLEAFDQLPRAVKEVLWSSEVNLAAPPIADEMRQRGVRSAIELVRARSSFYHAQSLTDALGRSR